MSSTGDDVLRIPIEIKTDDLKELQELIQDISQAEQDIREIKPRKGKGRGDDSSRAPFQGESAEEKFGIFRGGEGGGVPGKPKDTKSAAPVQRKDEFAKLKEDVKDVKSEQLTAKGALGGATQAVGFAQLIGSGKAAGSSLGIIGGIAGKAFLPLAIITTIIEIVHSIIGAVLAPGGPFDRRFKRDIKKEASSATERALKAQISQSLKIVRVTTKAGVRGTAATGAANAYLQGNPIYDSNLEMRSKGI